MWPGFENCEDWEDKLFANQIPEFRWELLATSPQGAEEGIQCPDRDPISGWRRTTARSLTSSGLPDRRHS